MTGITDMTSIDLMPNEEGVFRMTQLGELLK
jgi:hypothetical protein